MERAPVPPPRPRNWPRARGPHYLAVLEELHRLMQPDWYLEIGTARGNSLKLARGGAVAVDPDFRVTREALGDRDDLHMIQMTSDDFFASGTLATITARIDLAFIDGLHLFENVLRDFINTERHCRAESVILLHDLIPFSEAACERVWDPEKTRGWSGDVWKLVPILRDYRPDLELTVLDPRPTGLGVVSNLDPDSGVLDDAFDEIVARYRDMTITRFGLDRLIGLQALTPVAELLPSIDLEDVA